MQASRPWRLRIMAGTAMLRPGKLAFPV